MFEERLQLGLLLSVFNHVSVMASFFLCISMLYGELFVYDRIGNRLFSVWLYIIDLVICVLNTKNKALIS